MTPSIRYTLRTRTETLWSTINPLQGRPSCNQSERTMDPISLIVAALAAGAVAGVKDTASAAVKDTYAALKRLVADRHAAVHADVEKLEQTPTSEGRQAVVKEELETAGAANDPELIA